MNDLFLLGKVLAGLIIGLGCWIGWQLLRQNGRILLRLDELEERLDELESQSLVPSAGATRSSKGSLARSKIERNGLKVGTLAPNFRLRRLDDSELALEDLRGRRVVLVFSDPQCGPCNALAPQLEEFHREQAEVAVVIISRGEPKENRAKVKEHGLTFPVVLQQRWEISRLYGMFATPIAYLIDEAGVIAAEVAVGVEPIVALLAKAKDQTPEPAEVMR